MSMLPKSSHEERIGERYVKEKEVSMHTLNKRADKKLEYVTDCFELAMGDKHTHTNRGNLKKELYCQGFKYLNNLTLDYLNYQNRLWAFAYNLNLKSTFDASQTKYGETENCRFVVKSKGTFRISSPQWLDGGSQCSEEKSDAYLKRLNHKLILDRIQLLDMTKLEVTYSKKQKKWTIRYQSLIGSTNWILIPPVTQLIKYKPEEVVRTLEFFDLVLDAVINPYKDVSQPKKKR